MKKRAFCFVLPVITLLLELLPYGAVCNFADPEGAPLRKTFSYFDLTPFGYANFAPFLTALVTCVVFVLLLAYFVKGNTRIRAVAVWALWAGAVLSLCPLLYGVRFFSVVGALISASLIAELIFLLVTEKSPTK